MAGLKPLLTRCSISGEHAGVHLLLTFPSGEKEKELIRQAEEKEIRVYGLSEYDIDEQKNAKATILLGYANMSEEAIRDRATSCVRYGNKGVPTVELLLFLLYFCVLFR